MFVERFLGEESVESAASFFSCDWSNSGIVFCSTYFVLQGLKYTFQGLKHMSQALKHMSQALKHKILRGERIRRGLPIIGASPRFSVFHGNKKHIPRQKCLGI